MLDTWSRLAIEITRPAQGCVQIANSTTGGSIQLDTKCIRKIIFMEVNQYKVVILIQISKS